MSIYHYILCPYLLFWFYIRVLLDKFCFFEELSWEDIQRESRTGWVFLNSYKCLAGAFFWALWLTVDVSDNQSRGLLLCCSDLISVCYQGIGIILFCSCCSQRTLSMWKVNIVPKLGKVIFGSWVWLLAGTPATIQWSSQQRAHSHMH